MLRPARCARLAHNVRTVPRIQSALTTAPPRHTPTRAASTAGAPELVRPATEVSTLPNQVRVATEPMPGHFSAVGVYVDAGSRFERLWVPGESGVSHMLDRMAFKVGVRCTDAVDNLAQLRGHGADDPIDWWQRYVLVVARDNYVPIVGV